MTKSKKRFWIGNSKSLQTNFAGRSNSIEQYFAGLINRYVTKRKALAKDKEGIRIKISTFNNGNLTLTHNENIGQYSVEVLMSQLLNNNNTLRFKCSLYNDRKQVILLTAASLLDACSLTSCYDNQNDWMKTNNFIRIEPKTMYDHVIIKFQIDEPVITSYQIPIALNFRAEKGERSVTFCRTILLNILDSEKKTTSKEKEISPFTGKPFGYKYLIEHFESKEMNESVSKFLEKEYTGKTEFDELEILETLSTMPDARKATVENYAEKFHNCLWLEEITNRKMLQKYNMENVTMTLQDKRLKLKVPGLEQNRPKLIIGDKIHIAVHDDHTGYVGYIDDVEYCYVFIANIDNELLETISECPNSELDVSFQLGELPLERAHQGVQKVCNRGIVNSLFNTHNRTVSQVTIRKIISFNNPSIIRNNEQRTAVENILNCTSGRAPYIVYGPPGTGKTVTIVEAIYQILKKTSKKILVCAPSNAACDMLTEKLVQFCRSDELIRIHSQARDKTTIPEKIRPYSNFSSENEVHYVGCEALLRYRIIVTTLILIGRYSVNDITERNLCEFDYVFIDEAAQASEPDTCVAIAMLKLNGNIVLAGDPKQLGPIVLSTHAQEYGLDISLLERLMSEPGRYAEENPLFITMLKNNFRSHADILHLPNKLFYRSKLKAVSEKAQNHPVSKFDVYSNIKILQAALTRGKKRPQIPGRAVEFIGVSSKELCEGHSPSYYNESEAIMVIECVRTLMEANFIGKINLCDIGVISPYIRQVYKIKALLHLNNFKDVEVGSTEAFQGREKLVIIISTVRAQNDLLKNESDYNLGFVKNPRRFNVALTRAMSKLIVIGCPAVLNTDSKWRDFIELCRNKQSYHGFPSEKRNEEKMEKIIENFRKFPVFMSN